ncbi:MAG: tRNA lysidine(34) synthetase TilS, partial [Endomicrobiia bacterium]
MFLLFLTYKFLLKNNFKIVPVYINHKVRTKKEIENDIKTIKTFCENYDLNFITEEINPKKFDENTLRILRYEKIFEISKKQNCNLIFTGHTQNDVVETFFINLLRGSGIKGLCSITPVREIEKFNKKFYIVRPIIDIKKEEIIKILQKQNIKYVIDTTNLKLNYTRNFLRNKILPLFKKINSKFENNILSTIEILTQTDNFVSEIIKEKFQNSVKQNNSYVYIDLNKFLMYNDFAKKEILHRTISGLALKKNLNFKQGYKKIVNKIIDFINDKKNILEINKNFKLKKINKKLYMIIEL